MSSIFNDFRVKSKITLILAVLCIVYCASAITVIILAISLVKMSPAFVLETRDLIAFSLISFSFSIVLSIYFFFNALGRRRRKSDRTESTGKASSSKRPE